MVTAASQADSVCIGAWAGDTGQCSKRWQNLGEEGVPYLEGCRAFPLGPTAVPPAHSARVPPTLQLQEGITAEWGA